MPFLRELVVVNDGEADLADVELTLSCEPAVLAPRTWRIDLLGGGQHYHLSDLDITLDAGLLARLTEAEAAQAVLSLHSGGAEVARLVQPFELLPRNQWGGVGHMPEMVAAFVQPNDPAVDRVLKRAAEVLRQNGCDGALNGYLAGPKRAWELASAVWTAVGALGLDYALPPASFEHRGQKVRSPSQILDGGLATCLDSTLLFCACLEQCGLNPLVIFTHGHAFAGVWLKAEEFTSVVVDDVTALRKRAMLNEMVLFETTLITQRPCPGFGRAAERGAQQVSEAEEDSFELVVDVRRARLQRIRPLASGDAAAFVPSTEAEPAPEPSFEAAPDILAEDAASPAEEKPTTPQGRLDRWQRKLLDLSLRNSLLNFRASKRVIRLDAPDPGRLEDLLAEGHRLKLLPRPELMDGADPRSQAIHEGRHNEDLRRQHALDALKRDEVLVDQPLPELENRLVELYRQARANLQEGGANTLFLALGFLAWTRNDKDESRHRAPLILLPVTLERKSVRSGFSLLLHEDEPRFNPTLLEMLRQDFKLSIPVAEGELPKDEHGLDITGIWRAVAQVVKDIKGWEVTEEVVLSTFSFSKYLMWKDLVARLCRQAGCERPEELAGAEHRSARRQAAEAELAEQERALLDAGDGLGLAELAVEAASIDRDHLAVEVGNVLDRLAVLEHEADRLKDELTQHRMALEVMDGNSAAAAAAEDVEQLSAGLRDDAARYIRFRLGHALLRQSVERFRRRHQGPLLERAADLFRRLTLGAFAGLDTGFDDHDQPILLAVREGGDRLEVKGLSEGTRDQLFLALRLAAVDLHLAAGRRLPFIADDLLIHFDDDRAAAALAVLADLATRTQVLFFTHNRHLVDLARAHLPAEAYRAMEV